MSGGRRRDPKATLAINVWAFHAGEIETDLALRGIDIADWHQGTRDEHGRLKLSSRKLLVLLKHMSDEDSIYKRSISESGWPESTQILSEIHKESALDRASHYVGTKHQYEPKIFLSPKARVEHFEEAQANSEFIEEARDDLLSGLL